MRARPRPLTLALALILAQGCSGESEEPLDCGTRSGERSDRCWAERAVDAELEVQDRHQAALRIQDPTLRDLALSTVAPSLGVDACDTIHDTMLRRSCQARTRRPHLDIPEPDRPVAALPTPTPTLSVQGAEELEAIRRTEEACDPLPSGLQDPCRQQRVDSEPPSLCWVPCTLVQDDDLRGDCAARAATRLGIAELPELAAAVCATLEDPRWRGECSFRTSEALPLNRPGDCVTACTQALGFEDECRKHLVQRHAQATVLRARFGHADDVLFGLTTEGSTLSEALADQPDAAWLARLYWYEAFHALLAEALQHERLEATIAAGGPTLATREREGPWRDVATKLCAYHAARQGSLDSLEALRARVTACTEAVDTPEESDSLLPSQAPRSRFGELTTSEVPAPIQPRAGCELTPDTRRDITALWGLEQLPWSQSEALVERALAHPEPAARAYTLDMVEHKAFFWQRQDREGQLRLAERLTTQAQDDPSAPVRERAAILAQALEAGERPGRWAFHASGVCAGSPRGESR